jgi:hypothetical protein
MIDHPFSLNNTPKAIFGMTGTFSRTGTATAYHRPTKKEKK